MMKQRNKLEGFHRTQRHNKDTGLNKAMKTYPYFIFPVYIRQVPKTYFF